jgi:heat shock protein HslJ
MIKRMLFLVCLLLVAVVPAFAQDDATNTITFNGFSFSFPSSLATNVNVSQFTNITDTFPPNSDNTQFLFYNSYPAPESPLDAVGAIFVYPVETLNADNRPQYDQLQTLLNNRTDLTSFTVIEENADAQQLPYLPQIAAGQVLRARPQYIESASVSGISYLTVWRQDVSPLMGNEFLYTFQGISSDGANYISAVFRLDTALIPSEMPADFDIDAFSANFIPYLNETVATLTNAAPTDFNPSLDVLDNLVRSFVLDTTFAGEGTTPDAVVTSEPEATEQVSAGALGSIAVWNLVSYGDPTAPTPVLTEAPITLQFTGQGVGGNTGCNTYGGNFEFSNDTLTIGQLVTTLVACEEPIMAQERAYLDALQTATNYSITGDQLTITYPGGALLFTPGA